VDIFNTFSAALPVLKTIAISSALLKEEAPLSRSRSLGRSPDGKSRIMGRYSAPSAKCLRCAMYLSLPDRSGGVRPLARLYLFGICCIRRIAQPLPVRYRLMTHEIAMR
jgi:hypothetical protein